MNSSPQSLAFCWEVEEAVEGREAEGTAGSDAIEMKQILEIEGYAAFIGC